MARAPAQTLAPQGTGKCSQSKLVTDKPPLRKTTFAQPDAKGSMGSGWLVACSPDPCVPSGLRNLKRSDLQGEGLGLPSPPPHPHPRDRGRIPTAGCSPRERRGHGGGLPTVLLGGGTLWLNRASAFRQPLTLILAFTLL